eukprot:gene55538-74150_t
MEVHLHSLIGTPVNPTVLKDCQSIVQLRVILLTDIQRLITGMTTNVTTFTLVYAKYQ